MNRTNPNVRLVKGAGRDGPDEPAPREAPFQVHRPRSSDAAVPDAALQLMAEGPAAYVAAVDGRVLFVNAAFEALAAALKAPPDVARARLVEHVFPLAAVVTEVLAAKAPVRREDVLKTDGGIVYLTSEHRPLHDSEGRITAVGGFVHDSSREATAWIEALTARERFRDIARLVSDWLWETDAQFNLTFVSTRIVEILGLHPRHLVGSNLFSLGTFETGAGGLRSPSPAGRSPFRDVPFSIVSAGGERYLFQLSGIPVFDDSTGAFKGFRGTARDITAETRAQHDAMRSQRRLAAAIENIAEGFVLWGREERLAIANPRFREMFSDLGIGGFERLTFNAFLTQAESIGFFADRAADATAWRKARREALAGTGGRCTVRLANGRWYSIGEHRTGNAFSVVSIVTDITDIKAREEALVAAKNMAEVANRSKGEFLANMSHELKTPLNAIIGFSEIMERGTFGPLGSERYASYVHDIIRSSHHLLGIINDILDAAKMEAGKLELDEEEFAVANDVRDTVRLLCEQASVARVELTFDADSDLPRLYADRRKVCQIALNLLSNAIKFTPPGGRVSIRLALQPSNALMLTVSDTGIGIAESDIPKVLTPFGQVESALHRRHDGTGLGLPLTRALTELHGGSFAITSRLGHGTSVTVEFPAERTRD